MKHRWLAAGLGLAVSAGAWAAELDPVAQQFGAREAATQASLSPAGTSVAIVAPTAGRGSMLLVGRVDGGELKPVMRTSGDPDRLTGCQWSTDTRLICSIFMLLNDGVDHLGFTRMVSVNADGSDLKMLSARTNDRSLGVMQHGGSVIDWQGEGGEVLMTRSFVPERSVGSLVASSRDGLGVERVDTTTLKRSVVEAPTNTAVEYITDGHGAVRIRGMQPRVTGGYAGDAILYSYRQAGSREWKPLGSYSVGGETGFSPYAVDRTLNVAYGFERLDGRQALYRVALDSSLKRELVFSRPDATSTG